MRSTGDGRPKRCGGARSLRRPGVGMLAGVLFLAACAGDSDDPTGPDDQDVPRGNLEFSLEVPDMVGLFETFEVRLLVENAGTFLVELRDLCGGGVGEPVVFGTDGEPLAFVRTGADSCTGEGGSTPIGAGSAREWTWELTAALPGEEGGETAAERPSTGQYALGFEFALDGAGAQAIEPPEDLRAEFQVVDPLDWLDLEFSLQVPDTVSPFREFEVRLLVENAGPVMVYLRDLCGGSLGEPVAFGTDGEPLAPLQTEVEPCSGEPGSTPIGAGSVAEWTWELTAALEGEEGEETAAERLSTGQYAIGFEFAVDAADPEAIEPPGDLRTELQVVDPLDWLDVRLVLEPSEVRPGERFTGHHIIENVSEETVDIWAGCMGVLSRQDAFDPDGDRFYLVGFPNQSTWCYHSEERFELAPGERLERVVSDTDFLGWELEATRYLNADLDTEPLAPGQYTVAAITLMNRVNGVPIRPRGHPYLEAIFQVVEDTP
jgi:hypothetical protein